MVAKIFDKLMGFSTSDFPKCEVELIRFRSMLEVLRCSSEVEGGDRALLETRLYNPLVQMEVQQFPKTLQDHMVFNGSLLNLFMARAA
jgi:hypothetical protein